MPTAVRQGCLYFVLTYEIFRTLSVLQEVSVQRALDEGFVAELQQQKMSWKAALHPQFANMTLADAKGMMGTILGRRESLVGSS